jgi:hypothetical protein
VGGPLGRFKEARAWGDGSGASESPSLAAGGGGAGLERLRSGLSGWPERGYACRNDFGGIVHLFDERSDRLPPLQLGLE